MELLSSQLKEVIVVEGYHDLSKLHEINPNWDIVITNGSEVSQSTLNELNLLNKSRGLILFLDPDMQGERIRRLINAYVGDTLHAFLPKHQCISKNKKKVGIEHATKAHILEAINSVKTGVYKSDQILDLKDLYQMGLIGKSDSKSKRKLVSEHFGIGLCNGKSLCRKLNMFNIDKEAVISALEAFK